MNKKGIALILSFIIIVILTILGSALLLRSISERVIAQQYAQSTQAFWLAEAGINCAVRELDDDFNISQADLIDACSANLGQGSYAVASLEDTIVGGLAARRVTVEGFVPAGAADPLRTVRVLIRQDIPPNFFDNAIYSAGEVDLNGNAYSVTGDVRFADEMDNRDNVDGTITQDPSISPLALLDFEELLAISQRQQNVYVMSGNQLVNEATGSTDFPANFWSAQGTDGIDNDGDTSIDEADEMVNVVYVDGNLTLKGNIGTIGGFFAVVGDVINTPDVTQDAVINGNGTIDGVIYTRGEFRINGGAGNLNIDGGVWAGEEARLNGNANVTYNPDFMDAIANLNLAGEAQIISWQETQNPYPLTP